MWWWRHGRKWIGGNVISSGIILIMSRKRLGRASCAGGHSSVQILNFQFLLGNGGRCVEVPDLSTFFRERRISRRKRRGTSPSFTFRLASEVLRLQKSVVGSYSSLYKVVSVTSPQRTELLLGNCSSSSPPVSSCHLAEAWELLGDKSHWPQHRSYHTRLTKAEHFFGKQIFLNLIFGRSYATKCVQTRKK